MDVDQPSTQISKSSGYRHCKDEAKSPGVISIVLVQICIPDRMIVNHVDQGQVEECTVLSKAWVPKVSRYMADVTNAGRSSTRAVTKRL